MPATASRSRCSRRCITMPASWRRRSSRRAGPRSSARSCSMSRLALHDLRGLSAAGAADARSGRLLRKARRSALGSATSGSDGVVYPSVRYAGGRVRRAVLSGRSVESGAGPASRLSLERRAGGPLSRSQCGRGLPDRVKGDCGSGCRLENGYFGASRIAPSRRIALPFSMSFSTMLRTSAAYSAGRPRRDGMRDGGRERGARLVGQARRTSGSRTGRA